MGSDVCPSGSGHRQLRTFGVGRSAVDGGPSWEVGDWAILGCPQAPPEERDRKQE